MNESVAVVVTSIAAPNRALRELARGCAESGYQFIVIGDEASPKDFHLKGCSFYNLQDQRETGFKFAELCPTKHYARKNLGYLIAARNGASMIIETDDDNIPLPEFWNLRERNQDVATLANGGWINVYQYFSEARIWPRGLPLDHIKTRAPAYELLAVSDLYCPIQQGLADENPDVDAIYRLALPLPQVFRKDRRVALARNSWCPFNSQNTTWWFDAFPLLYLPSYCSFRMTDIWRSFIAQRIAWTNSWGVLFHEPTVWQKRNDHDLMRDFRDEVQGYLHNSAICDSLGGLQLLSGVERMSENLRACYQELIQMSVIDERELDLVEAWLADLKGIGEQEKYISRDKTSADT